MPFGMGLFVVGVERCNNMYSARPHVAGRVCQQADPYGCRDGLVDVFS